MISQFITDSIEELYKELKDLPPLNQEQKDKLDEKVRLEFHYNTNHIEGNTLTYGETKLFFLFEQYEGGHTRQEYDEMAASDVAYKLVQELAEDNERPLTEAFIKNLNNILLVRPYWKEAETADGQKTRRLISIGDYKKHPNHVRLSNGEIFRYTNPEDVQKEMAELLDWYNAEVTNAQLSPFQLAAVLHHRFVLIHPFDDGNGRISRLLVNYVLLKHNYPPIIIKSEDKVNYLRALNQADTGNIDAFCEYIGVQLISSLRLCIKAANNEEINDEDDWKKKLSLLDRELSKNKEIKVKKSAEVTQDLILDKIAPLIDLTFNELKIYDDYFLGKSYSYKGGLDSANTFWDHLIPKYVKEEKYQQHYYNDIKFTISYRDFRKNGDTPFNIAYDIFFDFKEYYYTIRLNSDEVLYTKYYHEFYTEEEIKKIVHLSGEKIYGLITDKLREVNSNK